MRHTRDYEMWGSGRRLRRFRSCAHSYCTEPAREGHDTCAGHDERRLLEAELARLRAEADQLDANYAAGRATKADILRSEDQMDRVLRKLAALPDA
jgi:hypothetical protein